MVANVSSAAFDSADAPAGGADEDPGDSDPDGVPVHPASSRMAARDAAAAVMILGLLMIVLSL